MAKHIKNFVLFTYLFFVVSCNEVGIPPRIVTGEASNIDESGVVFHAKILSLGNGIPDEFGFVWDTLPSPTLSKAEKYTIHKKAKTGNYAEKITFSLIKSKKYFARAFILASGNVYYGEEISFVSLGGKLPEIQSIKPTHGNINDTLVIIGKNFSSRSSKVMINRINAQLIRSNQDSIFVIIPSSLNAKKSELTLENLNQIIVAKDSFRLIEPEIFDFEEKQFSYGDEITIKGNMFSASPSTIKIYFDAVPASFTVVDNQTIKAIVPNETETSGSIKVKMNNLEAISAKKYSLSPFEFYDFNPKIALTGSTITISGKNFSPILKNNIVYIGGVKTQPISVTKNTLELKLPLQDSVVYENRMAKVVAKIGGGNYEHNEPLLINDKWFRKANPIANLYFQNSLTIDKIAYIGLNNTKDLWSYNTETNIWKKLPEFPARARSSKNIFAYGDMIYFGVGSSNGEIFEDWWEFNTITNQWKQKNNFPEKFAGTTAFKTLTGCYLPNKHIVAYDAATKLHTFIFKAWRYDVDNDTWSNVELGKYIYANNESLNYWHPFLANENSNEVYINWGILENYKDTEKMFILDTKNKTTTRIADYPNNTYRRFFGFMVNNNVYIKRMDDSQYNKSQMYYYDKQNDKWRFNEFAIYNNTGGGWGACAFVVNDIAYIGSSYINNRLYEFDPNR